jgi:hypothetical protein
MTQIIELHQLNYATSFTEQSNREQLHQHTSIHPATEAVYSWSIKRNDKKIPNDRGTSTPPTTVYTDGVEL